jgi:hypothetical protein
MSFVLMHMVPPTRFEMFDPEGFGMIICPDTTAGTGGGNLADQLVNSALRYRGQAPLVDAILKEIGITGGDINGLTAAIKPEPDHTPPPPKGK